MFRKLPRGLPACQARDGGIDYDPLPNLHLAATLLANRLEDAIGNVPLTGATHHRRRHRIARQNLDAVSSKGAELDARLAIGAWRLAASYAYTDAHVRSDTPIGGLRPARTAKHFASGTLGGTAQSTLSPSATLRYIGPQFEDDQNSETLKGAVTLDARALVTLSHGLAIEARAENLFNTRVAKPHFPPPTVADQDYDPGPRSIIRDAKIEAIPVRVLARPGDRGDLLDHQLVAHATGHHTLHEGSWGCTGWIASPNPVPIAEAALGGPQRTEANAKNISTHRYHS